MSVVSAESRIGRQLRGKATAWRDSRQLVVLAGLVALGTGIRLWIAFTNYGLKWDIDSAYIVAHWLTWHPLHVYSSQRYPYPGGFLPVILICRWVADITGAAFYGVWKVPSILADAGIAIALAWGLEQLGVSPRRRLAAVALVALGPSFIIISGYHGQIDASAILPALIAVILWRLDGERRAWQAGVLIGIGAAIKTVPILMLFALLPTVRSRREATILIGCALAIPICSLLPFAIANWHNTVGWQHENHGAPGLGGLSLVIQPSLLRGWLHNPMYLAGWSQATKLSWKLQNYVVGAAVLLASGFMIRKRMDAVHAAALVWLIVYVANFNWAFQYFIWGLPFFLLAGWRREAAALQLVLLLPAAEVYFHFAVHTLRWAYIPLMLLVWSAFLAATVLVCVRYRSGASATTAIRSRKSGPQTV